MVIRRVAGPDCLDLLSAPTASYHEGTMLTMATMTSRNSLVVRL
jgi:hypothetical protein